MTDIHTVLREVRQLFHTGAALADAAHRDLDLTAGQRAVLEAVFESPGQTVPGIARQKRVTRQHIQVLVNQLLEANLVEKRHNPAHSKSPLLHTTPQGRELYETVLHREGKLLQGITRELPQYDLPTVAACLRNITSCMEAVLPADPEERKV